MTENLGDFFKKKISEMDGIPVEEVTAEYIRKQRAKQDFPLVDFSIGLEYTGFDRNGLKLISNKEYQQMEIEADEFLSQFSNFKEEEIEKPSLSKSAIRKVTEIIKGILRKKEE